MLTPSKTLDIIGLCNTTYKIITKIIVNRLKPFLPLRIGPSQGSFLSNRRASDNVIIFQEFITHFSKIKGKARNMVLKIDLKKAFDRIEWSFIKETPTLFHLPTKLISLIISCITSTSISILINDDKTTPFKPTRGIRQEDSLSPYIFILCMRRLSRDIDAQVSEKIWNPISICINGPKISHLFFADDLTIFSKVTPEDSKTIIRVLNKFCQASGQKINT